MPLKKTPPPSVSRITNITVGGDVNGNIVVGDHNTVNQTIIQKFFNIFKSDAENVDQRNRRIMLGHVENFWVKGILEKSLHGAALLDLGIKEDPDALNYPWAIKREANQETLPAGTSMLEIFQEIGMGRSLLILGAPGSGKTTMLLELTRQLIERAREDVTEPIPVIFNLSSWTEQLPLADWLARELNIIYTIPKKVAPTWIKENKMLLLLDGLDEVKQESRDKCVDAINLFRKENGLTSMAVCSRIQDYAELKAQLTFDGAIEIQPLTSNQVDEYFKRFGKGLAGIKQVLEKDTVLREMAETPLFLNTMTLAYRDIQSKDILVSENLDVQRKHLFDTYIERMFERAERSRNEQFKQQDVIPWLSWLARKMINYNQTPFLLERIQPKWLPRTQQVLLYRLSVAIIGGLIYGLIFTLTFGLFGLIADLNELIDYLIYYLIGGSLIGLLGGWLFGREDIKTVDKLTWNQKEARDKLKDSGNVRLFFGPVVGGLIGLLSLLVIDPFSSLLLSLYSSLLLSLFFVLHSGLTVLQVDQTIRPEERILFSVKNLILTFFIFGLLFGLLGLICWPFAGPRVALGVGLILWFCMGLGIGMIFGGFAAVQHYILRSILGMYRLLPFRLVPFLNHCIDLIFLRRVGGGYIFVHRLLMEHFAAMYPEE